MSEMQEYRYVTEGLIKKNKPVMRIYSTIDVDWNSRVRKCAGAFTQNSRNFVR
jgi:hypothetical protein